MTGCETLTRLVADTAKSIIEFAWSCTMHTSIRQKAQLEAIAFWRKLAVKAGKRLADVDI
jgi:hypothetical protein